MKNKILIVISSLKLWWGAEKSATQVWNELYKKWYEISYLTFYQSEKKYDFLWKELCLNEKITTNIFKNIFKLFYRAYNIKKYCKKNKINTVISHLEEANFSSIISKLFLNKSKIIVVNHSNPFNQPFLTRKIFPIYNFSNLIISVSKESKNIFIENFWINESKINVIYNMFDIVTINKLSMEKILSYDLLFKENIFTFINVWRTTKAKNQKLLLESFDILNQKYNNTQLIILHWDWELEENLKNQRELLLSKENIHFLWNQKNPFNFLKNSNCFVFSSIFEWFPMVIPEALACSLPIISTDCPTWPKEALNNSNNISFNPVKDIFKADYWILVPNNNLIKLYEAMEMIYLDENLRNFYKKKSLERSKDFDINNIIKKWEDII